MIEELRFKERVSTQATLSPGLLAKQDSVLDSACIRHRTHTRLRMRAPLRRRAFAGPRYHLFGPAVEFANLMESSGVPGKVQLSRPSRKCLAQACVMAGYSRLPMSSALASPHQVNQQNHGWMKGGMTMTSSLALHRVSNAAGTRGSALRCGSTCMKSSCLATRGYPGGSRSSDLLGDQEQGQDENER